METERQVFLAKLKAFSDAANELSKAWGQFAYEHPLLAANVTSRNYPFAESFIEIAHDIYEWRSAVQRQTRFGQLHANAPLVPPGLQPKEGVEYGCGRAECRECYEPEEESSRAVIQNLEE